MKEVRHLVLPCLMLLLGCDGRLDGVRQAAESARSATERMADASTAESNAREQQILADAEAMQAKANRTNDLTAQPRYQIRKDGDGWTVYDTANHRPARTEGKFQSGLSRADAEAVFATLNDEDQGEHFGKIKPLNQELKAAPAP